MITKLIKRVPQETTRLAKPHSWASLAFIGLPVKMRSIALENPTSAGSLTVPPSIKGTPAMTQLKCYNEL